MKKQKTPYQPTVFEQEHIKKLDAQLLALLKLVDSYKELRVGDIMVEEATDRNGKTAITKNHLGFPFKFRVAWISSSGVPYLQRLQPNGDPYGGLLTPPMLRTTVERMGPLPIPSTSQLGWDVVDAHLLPDPDQANAILLGDETQPYAQAVERAALWNEIARYNRKLIVKTWPEELIRKFLRTLKKGDCFWRSNKTMVRVVKPFCPQTYSIEVEGKKGKTVRLSIYNLLYKRVYKAQPRSFSEESKKM